MDVLYCCLDLQPLTIPDGGKTPYTIKDGDIPCTPETEPTYSYIWNFCAEVPPLSVPSMCKADQHGAVFQYVHRDSDGYEECNVIGHYDASRDDTYYVLLDKQDPTKGISMTYKYGDKCPAGQLRSATIDLVCANVEFEALSATEPQVCEYHLLVNSWYGCPTQCPVTSGGLCSSHGYCKYDTGDHTPHCFCNKGYTGTSCSEKSSDSTYSGYSMTVEMTMMVLLLLIAFGLVSAIAFMAYKISKFRDQQQNNQSAMSYSEMEMTRDIHF